MDLVYLDNNATTSLAPGVLDAMRPHLDHPGNAASAHRFGRRAARRSRGARERVAALLGAHADEVVFTSGATEANNLAVTGLAGDPPGAILASPIEHPSVAEPLRQLRRRGFDIEYLPAGPDGRVLPPLSPCPSGEVGDRKRLVACMLVNHETGAVQPVRELRDLHPDVPFHCDAVQGAGKLPLDFHALGVTTLAISAHKFHGPQGVGALLVRRGAPLRPLLHGGHQQRGLRPGTEPVALAVGLAAALELACRQRETRLAHVAHLRGLLLTHLQAHAAPVVVNGDGLPYTLNVSFPGTAGDLLLMALDLAGVACSTGSACSSGSLLPSPTLQAMGVPDDALRSAIRFSFGALTTADEALEAARRISAAVNRLRRG
ncbi:MAG: cysteine desulfurase family protein [Gemmataceae bacterium]